MKNFMDENFLLQTETAQKLYHEHAAKMPIIDYHCHLIPQMVADDYKFKSLTEIWLGGDHYKWRAMRTNGVDERYCTGKDTTDWEKFEKWAETVPYTFRNPLYHWTHLELKTAFGIDKILSPKTAREIYDECNEKLAQPEYSARGMMRRYHVEVVCTTDDPIDSLEYHIQTRESGFEIKMLPTWRPDKAMAVEVPADFRAYVEKLSAVSGVTISNFDDMRVRFLNRGFQNKLDRRELAWCESFPVRVSQNASYFFGDSKFDANPVGRILQLLGRNAGRELECFDWYFGRRSDGEKSRLCATIAAYFRSVQAIREILFSLVASDGKTPEGSRHMRADDLLEILKPVSAQIDEERLPALGRLFQDLADGFFDEPSRAPYLSRGAGRALTDRTETGELRWLRLGRQSGRRLLRELYSRCAPRSVWDVFHRWQGEVYYTVLRRPLSQDLPRGVYLLSRFEDQTGLDVTGLFWLENVTVGVAHLCKGEFFEELLDLLLSRPTREAALPAARPREETMVSGYSYLLQEAFEQYGRGMG